jgi:hypothetical protein
LCVLIEGEPYDSVPEEVLYDYKEKIVNGKTKKEKYMVEPLAADVRGESKNETLKKLKEEKLRLIAPMYNLDYDDLRQRHKIWKQKHMIHTSLAIAGAAIIFLIYSLFMIIKINMQQNVLAEYHAFSLVSQAEDYLKKDDRYNAIKLSYQASTNFYGIVMPYISDAEYMLTESLGVYDAGISYKATNGLKVDGVVTYINGSPNGKYAAIYDESEVLTLFNTETFDVIGKYEVGSLYNKSKFVFISDSKFAYINKDGNINIIDIEEREVEKEITNDNSFRSLAANDNYLVYVNGNTLYVYDTLEDKIVGEVTSKDSFKKELYFSADGKYLFAFSEEENFDINKEDHITIHTIKLKEAKEINKLGVDAGYVSGVITIDNTAYFLLNKTIGIKYSAMLLSYNYINGNTNYIKTFGNTWGKIIKRSYPDADHLAIVNYDTVNILNLNGEVVESYSLGSEIIGMYSYTSSEVYLVFLNNGRVIYINEKSKASVEYMGKYELNLNGYDAVELSENGYLLIPSNDNRVILYEARTSDDVEKLDITLDYISDDSIPLKEYDKVKDEYNIKNRSLVSKIFYDTDNKLLFVNYTNKDISIYDVESKKLLNTLTNVGKVNHYFGKDKYGRIYIGDVSNSYILDSKYNKVGHIKGLAKLEEDKVIITSDKKYYAIKIYNFNELKDLAKNYLGDFELKESEE